MNTPQLESDPSRISVIIPTRNRRRLLSLALASVLDQRGVQIHVIVVDDASTDGTAAMVTSLRDDRIQIVRNDVPLGGSAARNRGITHAMGDWVAFLDDDDIWAPDKLLLQIQALRASGRSWAYTGAVNITEDHRILGGAPPKPPEEVAESLHRINFVPGGCSSVVVSRQLLEKERFDRRYRLCTDWDLWIRLARVGLPAWVPKPLVGYRVHAGNASVDTRRYLEELHFIEDQYGGPVDRVVFYRFLALVSLRMNRQRQAFGYYLRATFHDRGRYLTRGFITDVSGVLQSLTSRVRGRLGLPIHQCAERAGDPNVVWKQEARVWLGEFVRRHAT